MRAVDFGFSESATNNVSAINRALAEAKRTGAARVELAPGVYRCYDAHGVFIEGFRDFTFDGKGAELIFQRESVNNPIQHAVDIKSANVCIIDCERTVVGGFKMDWDWVRDPLGFWCRPVNFHTDERAGESYIDLDLEKPHPRYPADVPVQMLMPMADSHLGARLEATRTPGCYFGMTEGHWGAKNKWLSSTRIRLWPFVKPEGHYIAPDQLERYSLERNRSFVKYAKTASAGKLYEILHYYYGMNGLNIVGNRHLTVRDVEIWSCRGFGVQTSGPQHHWQLVNVNVRPRPGSPLRFQTTYSYNVWCEGIGCLNIVVRGCRFENCLDT